MATSTSGNRPGTKSVPTTSRPRSVLLVLEAMFPRLGGGGAESQVLTLARCLRQRGVEPTIVVPLVPGGPSKRREILEGIEVVRVAYPHVRLVGGAILMLRLFALLFAWRRRYGVIHAHIAHNMAAVSAIAGAMLGKPVFVKITGLHEMNRGILDPAAPWPSWLRRAAIRRADAVQATSTRIGRLLAQAGFGPSRVVLVPNGVDMSRFGVASTNVALRSSLCGDADRVGIVVARLCPEKRHSMLLDAWARAFAASSRARLLLVGDGPLRGALEAQAERLGIASQVVFAGHRDDIPAMLSIADFALLTSDAEGLSNALLEYMAAGLPVLGSRVSGTEDFVTEGHTGWLFEPGDADGLARQLAAIAATPTQALERLGSEARSRVRSLASLEAVTDRLLELYEFGEPAPARAPAAA